MNTPSRSSEPLKHVLTLAVVMLLGAAFFRVARVGWLPEWQNFAPLSAIAVCGALFLPGWIAIIVPAAALIASDIVLNAYYGVSGTGFGDFVRYACYFLAIASGFMLRSRGGRAFLPALGVVTLNSLVFYVLTNTAAWMQSVGYAKTLGGWFQALTVGLPGFPPTWVFFRNSLVSDLLFTAVFFGAVALLQAKPALRGPQAAPARAV